MTVLATEHLSIAFGGVHALEDVSLAVAAGLNGGPRITIWDGKNVAAANGGTPAAPPLANAFVFEASQRDGAFVTLGDVLAYEMTETSTQWRGALGAVRDVIAEHCVR